MERKRLGNRERGKNGNLKLNPVPVAVHGQIRLELNKSKTSSLEYKGQVENEKQQGKTN